MAAYCHQNDLSSLLGYYAPTAFSYTANLTSPKGSPYTKWCDRSGGVKIAVQALWQFGAPEAEFLGGIGPAIDVLEGNAVRLRAVGTAILLRDLDNGHLELHHFDNYQSG
ncbi:unnamed protein product [Fusarium graminearum]|uniref:Chromosome 2, complete genome n=1 Tax=Gibberella zeae (strain ATCC MYA-4620 / CBS 123657 / FGSC 9075 / NRRL 31084 / PH-1) TaxID=229533 RepID=I1S9A7_GIBZE|nr:hypothetical protein FGSG_13437 [Fusarium graminearum PH-1]ESU15266.1 hypothetical protein FGSG_13437 [Fusarium graminearum PH-1]EYB25355.1 hypothetical protein FG05_13437 [Fusarium graminearum]CEF76391.1 unnamed protein product [Fusarium graminearum]CZS79685.1 unnamed protein product [Fusarium graminearum]|eukprot:XP_011320691.1 hypothetical protein FGSG_13437 [Fusarium graminearum PH-1]